MKKEPILRVIKRARDSLNKVLGKILKQVLK